MQMTPGQDAPAASGRAPLANADRETVLVVEDDPELRELYDLTLSQAGFRVFTAPDGQRGLESFETHAPSLILLDLGLGPDSIDGMEVCRRVRTAGGTPVIMLTGRADEADQLLGLHLGADDYLVKPISPRLLIARVEAVLRRTSRPGSPTGEVSEDGVRLDRVARTVHVHGAPVDLTRIQFDLLAALAEQPDRVITREELIQRVWGDDEDAEHRLDVHLSRLRSRITASGGPRIARVVRGVGFRY